MADMPFSGALQRAAHFAHRPPVPGINPEHENPDPDPDPFSPVPEGASPVDGQVAGDVWQPTDIAPHSVMQPRDITHSAPGLQPPVPSAVPAADAGQATTTRMIFNHSVVDYRADPSRYYRHAGQGMAIQWRPGRMPWQAGESVPEGMDYLTAGTNAYDFTNEVNADVYAGAPANVGRYRLQEQENEFGIYSFWTKQGQDADLRAYTGLSPAFPVDKERVPDSAPYTPNSSGTTTWTLGSFQIPSLFGLPSETSMTDYEVASEDAGESGAFAEDGRL